MEAKDIVEAQKKVRAEKPKENYMLIPLGYDSKYIVPYKDGVAILTALANAEKYEHSYSSNTKITPIAQDDFCPTILSSTEYELIKMANLLKVSVESLRNSMDN